MLATLVLFCIRMWQQEQYRDLKCKGPGSALSRACSPQKPRSKWEGPRAGRGRQGLRAHLGDLQNRSPLETSAWTQVVLARVVTEGLVDGEVCQWSGWSLVHCCYFHVSSLLSEYSIFPYGRYSPLWYSDSVCWQLVYTCHLTIFEKWKWGF